MSSGKFRLLQADDTQLFQTVTPIAAGDPVRIEVHADFDNDLAELRVFYGANLHSETPSETSGPVAAVFDGADVDEIRYGLTTGQANVPNFSVGAAAFADSDWIGPYGASTPTLVVDDSVHSHASESVALTQVHNLVVQDSIHSNSADVVALTQTHGLAVADSVHAHTSETPTFTQGHVLAGVADSFHAHTTEATDVRRVVVEGINADALLLGDVVDGANALFDTDTAWTGNTGSWSERFSMADPSGTVDGQQTVRVRARKTAALNPTMTVELWEDGVFVKTLLLDEVVTE
jgi:hypothetical protein